MSGLTLVSEAYCFGGYQQQYKHYSQTLDCEMHFSIFIPPQGLLEKQKVPAIYWLSGLTCTDQNFVTKAGAQKKAAELGLAIITPDTSPRGENIADAPDGAYDLGLGAGFYVNATQPPWNDHYFMYDYIQSELPVLVEKHLPILSKKAISGHSMGGHGALIIGLKNQHAYTSISAFAPIVSPSQCPWGEKALTAYLGDDKNPWKQVDACEILNELGRQTTLPILIDQGLDDDFYLSQKLTKPFEECCLEQGVAAQIRYHPHYDHSYYFIASFIEQHLSFHGQYLFD